MTKKMQQLIDDLKKELTDFGCRTEKQLAEASSCNKAKTEKLRAYLLSQGMPPALDVRRRADEDNLIICQLKRNDYILMTIALNTTGIKCAELADFIFLKNFVGITLAEYEQLTHDFITIIRFFEKLDYKALYAKVHEIDFHSYDNICNLFLKICDLKISLSHFKDYMAETFKE